MKPRLLVHAVLSALLLACALPVHGDTVYLKNGRSLKGVILRRTDDGIVLKMKYTTATISNGEIRSIEKGEAEQTVADPMLRLPGWDRCLEVAVRNPWVSDLRPIPASVIEKGILKNVPYKSFRSGEYEINVYGDPDKPACVEIGVTGKLLHSEAAKERGIGYIRDVLNNPLDRAVVMTLDRKKDLKKRDDMTFEVTPETDEDAYGGWWVSVYDVKALNSSRATERELKSVTERKQDIKKAATSTQQSDESTYSPRDLGLSRNTGSDRVYVRGYTRKDGTYVQPHTRSAPRK